MKLNDYYDYVYHLYRWWRSARYVHVILPENIGSYQAEQQPQLPTPPAQQQSHNQQLRLTPEIRIREVTLNQEQFGTTTARSTWV